MLAGIGGVLPRVAEAYRGGGGVPYERYGVEFRHGQGHINRPAFTNELPGEWLEAMPDVAGRLRGPGARVADVGCGQGWSSIAVARAFPDAQVGGVDADPGSIADARRHAAEAGVDVRFAEGDAAALAGGPYDLVMILETLHDLPQPGEALRAARAAAAPGGAVLVVDERVAERFTAPGDEVGAHDVRLERHPLPPRRGVATGVAAREGRAASVGRLDARLMRLRRGHAAGRGPLTAQLVPWVCAAPA